jgi:hypothetical protein
MIDGGRAYADTEIFAGVPDPESIRSAVPLPATPPDASPRAGRPAA